MIPEEWQRVKEVFEQALERAPEERSAFLGQACEGDERLCSEVQSLLSSYEQETRFMETPAAALAAQSLVKEESAALVGRQLGHYQIIRELGRGGMGVVYLAEDTSLGRQVALKVLPKHLISDPDRLRRFEREARAASALNHPNILTIHQIAQVDSLDFIATEFIDGVTLRERIASKKLTLSDALNIAEQIASALSAAHEAGIVHRDIKPENVMVRPDRLVKVLDFGLAKLTEPQAVRANEAHETRAVVETRSGMIMGTARYMSPEQARGLAVDARTDVWSLGVVLYEMIAGCAPFTGATDSDVMVSILEREPISLMHQVPEVSLELQRIVSKALRKDREERYQVIKDMLLDLKSLRQNNESDPNLALPTILGAAARSLFRSRRWIAPVLAGIVLMALGLTWWFRPSFPPPKVLGYTQLTNNGHPKSRLQTDGTRLYFWQLGGNMEVSVGGGEVVPLQPSFPVLDVSLSRSEFLIAICDRPPDPDMSLHSIPMVGGAPRQLAHTSSYSAKWSPDGRQLAYSQPTSLQIANADGTNSRQLVALENEPFGLHWSPDGKKLRFSLYDLKSKKTDIWEVFADGTNMHRWFPDWRPDLQKGEGCWMPDGRYFVFATSPSLVTQGGGSQQFGLWAARETTDVFHQPVHDAVELMTGPTIFHDLVASPDGTKLFAVSSGKGRGELVRYDVKSGEWRPAFSGMSSQFVSFSRDGNWMACVTYPDGVLWRSKTDGSQRLQLTFPPLEVALPRWSPDGTRISYTARTGTDNRKIYVIAAEGGDSQCLTQGDYLEEDPVWSPDGKSLAFHRLEGTGPEESRLSSIQILNLETRKTTLLPDSFGKYSPRWSAAGRFIAAMPFPGSRGLLLFDFQKQKWEALVQGFGVGYPSFSRDGKSVYFERFHASDLYRVKIGDRSLERIASMKESVSGDFGSWLGLDPSDAPLILKDVSSGEEVFALEWQAP